MKKTYLAFGLIILMFSSSCCIYAGGHDSLLFDGANSNPRISKDCGCKIKVLRQKGMVFGTFCQRDIASTCGEKDTVYKKVKALLPSYETDVLDGDTIKTGDFADCEVDLRLNDGKTIHLGRNASIFVSKDHCANPISVILHYGLMFLDLTGGDKSKTIGVKTERGEVINRGTKYMIESIIEDGVPVDIIRVYEGSVAVNQSSNGYLNVIKSREDEMTKLSEDYTAGRLGIQDYAKQMGVIQEEIIKSAPKNVIVEAGYETRLVGWKQPTDPVTFDVNEKRW